MLLFLIVIVPLIILFYTKYISYYRLWRKISKIPGPPPIPFIGNAIQFFNQTPADIFKITNKIITDYGGTARLWLGTDLTIILSDPKDIESFLTSQTLIDKAKDYKLLAPWLNTGLLLSTGKQWFQRRKALTPAFHFKILEQFVEVFERQGNTFVDIISKNTNESIDLYPLITLYALDVLCETAMGTMINAQRSSYSEYVQAVKEETHIVNSRFFDFILNTEFTFQLTSYGKRQEKALKILHEFTDRVIRKRREELEKGESKNDNVEDEIGTKKKEAFLDVLLKSTINGRPFTNDEIREEVDTFMFEGHDTTTSAITFIFFNLAKYPDIQEKCVQELIQVLGPDKSRFINYSEFSELNYLDKVIKESLRLFPSVPAIGRRLNQDITINGKLLPADSNIILHFFAMARNSKYFKDPLEFRPERFNTENQKDFETFAYVPFSAGPRNCIGQKFAILELKSIVAKGLRHYQFSLADNTEPVLRSELILRPDQPIYFLIKDRQN